MCAWGGLEPRFQVSFNSEGCQQKNQRIGKEKHKQTPPPSSSSRIYMAKAWCLDRRCKALKSSCTTMGFDRNSLLILLPVLSCLVGDHGSGLYCFCFWCYSIFLQFNQLCPNPVNMPALQAL